MITLCETDILGCYEIKLNTFEDIRGILVKTFHDRSFKSNGLITSFAEEFYSISHKRVLRGLHFQIPPMDHVKLVYCVAGEALDAVVDLREGSDTYGQHKLFTLSPKKANMIYIPSGLAHGFYALSDQTVIMYKTSTVHSPEHDKGIRWDSAGIAWPDSYPLISERDFSWPKLEDFRSPFRFSREI